MIRTAPEGRWFIVGAFVIAVGLLALRHRAGGSGSVLWLPIAIWVVAFFRDPERRGERGERLIMAPADGKVVSVIDTDEPAFFGGRARARLDLHERLRLPREPVSGQTERSAYRHYNAGSFGHAGSRESEPR